METPKKDRDAKFAAIGSIIFLIVVIAFCLTRPHFSSTENSNNTNQTYHEQTVNRPPDSIFVTYKQLAKDYRLNEINADNIYKDKVFNLLGVVISINKGFGDGMYLRFPENIQCNLKANQNSNASKLFPGQKILITGIGAGMLLGDVEMKDCEILEFGGKSSGYLYY